MGVNENNWILNLDITNILAFTLVAALLVISPGPNGVLIAKTVAASGRRAGFANIWGFVAAFYVHGSLSILGISVLLVQSAEAFFIFKMSGAAYLCWIGIKSLLAAHRSGNNIPAIQPQGKPRETSIASAVAEGFLTNVLNPKVSLFYLAAFPQFLSVGESAVSAYALVSLHALVNVIWFSAMIVLLSKFKGFVSGNSARLSKWLKSVSGVVFIGFGAKLAFLKPYE